MKDIQFHHTICPVCGAAEKSIEIFPANFSVSDLNPEIFSARRLPDRIHYRLVRCEGCGLVRSDPIADSAVISDLYRQSALNYSQEIELLRRTYRYYLDRVQRINPNRSALLEIGCGNGFFLEEARLAGYETLAGVEPSTAAVDQANPAIREKIVIDIFRPGIFEENTFDVICMFQVMDHFPDPDMILDACFRTLKKGGVILSVNHDVQALPNRLMGERSPIVDIEHTFLYDQKTIQKLFEKHNLSVIACGPAWNTISAGHFVQLAPIPRKIKLKLSGWLEGGSVGRLSLRMPIGNLFVIAQKPE